MATSGIAALARQGIAFRPAGGLENEGEIPAVSSVTIEDLLALEIPPREYILEPILRQKDVAMEHAKRGVGKTQFALNVGVAVASGGRYLTWTAPQPRPVLYIDGEMPARTMQERLADIARGSDKRINPNNLRLVCADLQDGPAMNLADPRWQQALDPLIAEAELVIVDSISTLTQSGAENEAESWLPLQEWALRLRRQGKTLLFVHHDGKNGQQRGTSRREDILDLVIGLRHPSDYEPSQGARFEVHFEKCRALYGQDVSPIEAALRVEDGRAIWTVKAQNVALGERAARLYAEGCGWQDVATELGVSRATAFRLRKEWEASTGRGRLTSQS